MQIVLMKKLFVLLLMSNLSVASELIVLSPNELFKLAISPNESIGIEKKDLVVIKDNGSNILIQAKKIGETVLRVGSKSFKIAVVNSDQLKNFQLLSNTVSLINGPYLDFSDGRFHLKGRLDQASTWLSIGNQYLNNFKIELEMSSPQLLLVEYAINKKLIQAGFFPIKIFQEPYPTVRLPKEALQNHQVSEIIGNYGITIKEDNKRIYTEPLIRVQVLLVEVRKSYIQNIGIEWPYQFSAKILPDGLLPSEDGTNLAANFFSKNGNGKILASPIIIAKSGSDAEFFAGGEFPIQTKTKQSHSISWKKYGIGLKIKPIADPDGKISLDLSSEVSSIDSGEKIDGIPSLFTNTLTSHFDLHSTQTIALSGLVKKVNGESLKKWPGLGDIPILGGLFTSREYQEDKTELLVFVTPIIVEQE